MSRKRYVFTKDDFLGRGQYIVVDRAAPDEYENPGYLSTVLFKLGWALNKRSEIRMIHMSDGLTYSFKDLKTLLRVKLNNPDEEPYRFATQKEVIRVIEHQIRHFKHDRERN